jgi:hypothetical protein
VPKKIRPPQNPVGSLRARLRTVPRAQLMQLIAQEPSRGPVGVDEALHDARERELRALVDSGDADPSRVLALAITLASEVATSTLAMRLMCEHLEPLATNERAALYALRFAEAIDLLGKDRLARDAGHLADSHLGDDVVALCAGVGAHSGDDGVTIAAGLRALTLDVRDPHRTGSRTLAALVRGNMQEQAQQLVATIRPSEPTAEWSLGAALVQLRAGARDDATARARALCSAHPTLAGALGEATADAGRARIKGDLDARIAFDDWRPFMSDEERAFFAGFGAASPPTAAGA